MEGAWAAIRRDAHGLTTHPGLLGGATSGARVAISQTSRLVQETRRAQVGVLNPDLPDARGNFQFITV